MSGITTRLSVVIRYAGYDDIAVTHDLAMVRQVLDLMADNEDVVTFYDQPGLNEAKRAEVIQ